MDNQEAKFILGAYRPGGADAGDAAFGEALDQAGRDPEVRAWFAREQAFDQAVAGKLRQIAPPAELREAILTGAKISEVRRVWWRAPAWVAMAASIAVLLGVASWRMRDGTGTAVDKIAELAVDDLLAPGHGMPGMAPGALQVKLDDPATRLAAGLSVDFAQLEAMGCRRLQLAGRDVMEVCFHRGSVEFHLYVTPRDDALRSGTGPQFASTKGLSTMAWTDAKYAYVVVSDADTERLKALL